MIAVVLLAYWPSSRALWRYLSEDALAGGHGLLVAALCLWLLVRARGRIAAARVQSRPWVLLLLPCSAAAIVFCKGGIETLQVLMLPTLILLGTLAASGPDVTRAIAVPVGFLYFAMPGWTLLAAPLQRLTLWIVRLVAPAIGIPATVSGSLISLPGDMSFEVGLVCSGIGFLVEGLAVAALLGELEEASPKRRVRLLASMAVIAVVTNWVRVLALVQLGYSTRMRHVLVTRHHLLFGYLLFALALVVFVLVARRRAPPSAPATPNPAPPAGRGVPMGYLTGVLALAGPPVLDAVLAVSPDSVPARQLQLPVGRAAWHGPAAAAADRSWQPVFVGPHDEWRGTYRNLAGRSVEIVAVGYSAQEQGRELVSRHNSLVGDGGLTAVAAGLVESGGQRYREHIAVDSRGMRSAIWSLYVIGGRPFVTPVVAQLYYGLRALGTPPYSMLFAFRTACSPSCTDARGVLGEFLRVVRPEALAMAGQPQMKGREWRSHAPLAAASYPRLD